MAGGIDTVIFDMDGVIFDSETLVLSSWKEVADRHGIKNVEEACHECLGTNSVVSKQIFLRHYGQDFPYDEYKAEMAEVFFSHASDGRLAKKPGVEELLKYLKENGFNPEQLVVERNFEIISKEQFGSVTIQDEDVIEVLRFVGGG